MQSYLKAVEVNIKLLLYPYYSRYYKILGKQSYPDFLIIGALKSGTTSLYQYLINHSGIVSSEIKETNYFSWEYGKGINHYLRYFPLKKDLNGRKVFESCPHYLADPESSNRIRQVLPKVKIIAILRDPIERAISNYNYFSNPTSRFGINSPKDLDKRSVIEAFRDDIDGKEKRLFRQYCRLSLFGYQLDYYYKYFNKNNILILDFDELKKTPLSTLEKISNFLDIDNAEFKGFKNKQKKIASIDSYDKISNKELNIYNSQEYNIEVPHDLRKELIAFYRMDISRLLSVTHTNFSWQDKYL